jgi:hypothetical protein
MEDLVALGIVSRDAYEGLLQRQKKVGDRLTEAQIAFLKEQLASGKKFTRLDVIAMCDKANVRTIPLRLQVLSEFGFTDGKEGKGKGKGAHKSEAEAEPVTEPVTDNG